MEIRPVRPDERARLGQITVSAYRELPGHVDEPLYEAELADVAARAEQAEVLAAVDDDGTILGGVTFVPDDEHPMAEHGVKGASSIRMLAVDGGAQGRGVGRALVEACIDRSRQVGATTIVLHSTTWMETAHRLYLRLGFVRRPDLDWEPVPGIHLVGFELPL